MLDKHVARVGMAGVVVVAALLVPVESMAQASAVSPAPAQEDLAKKLSNPVSDLVSVPFQFNWEQNVGPDEQTRFILNVQPVMPFSVSKDWNLIARVIVPLVSQPALFEGGSAVFGVSDVLTSFFFSPKQSGITWGVGPVLSLPSTAVPTLGTEKWSAGPTVVVLKQTGPWTYGALWNQLWSFAGHAERADVSQMFLQPFLSYQAKNRITLSVNAEASANWEADEETWTIPVNLSVAKLSSFGVFPASYQVGFGAYPVHPAAGPSWKIRGAVVILLPRTR